MMDLTKVPRNLDCSTERQSPMDLKKFDLHALQSLIQRMTDDEKAGFWSLLIKQCESIAEAIAVNSAIGELCFPFTAKDEKFLSPATWEAKMKGRKPKVFFENYDRWVEYWNPDWPIYFHKPRHRLDNPDKWI